MSDLLRLTLFREIIGERTARAKARRQQWKLVSGTMLIHCLLQVLSIALILHVFRTDARFESKGSHLGKHFFIHVYASPSQVAHSFSDHSFNFGVASAVVSLIQALLLTFTGLAARKFPTLFQPCIIPPPALSLPHELTQVQVLANLGQQVNLHSNRVIIAVPIPGELLLFPRVPLFRRTRLLLLVRYGTSRKQVKRMKGRDCWTGMKGMWRVAEAREQRMLFEMSSGR